MTSTTDSGIQIFRTSLGKERWFEKLTELPLKGLGHAILSNFV